MAALSLSVHFDWRLAPYDLLQTRAHAGVLRRAGLLDEAEFEQVLAALDTMATQVAAGTVMATPDDEDVHTAIERGLLELLGPVGGKLRAGRSRNDQVATDFRLYLRDQARGIAAALVGLIEADHQPGKRPRRFGRSGLHAPAACPARLVRPRAGQARTCLRPGCGPAR